MASGISYARRLKANVQRREDLRDLLLELRVEALADRLRAVVHDAGVALAAAVLEEGLQLLQDDVHLLLGALNGQDARRLRRGQIVQLERVLEDAPDLSLWSQCRDWHVAKLRPLLRIFAASER